MKGYIIALAPRLMAGQMRQFFVKSTRGDATENKDEAHMWHHKKDAERVMKDPWWAAKKPTVIFHQRLDK